VVAVNGETEAVVDGDGEAPAVESLEPVESAAVGEPDVLDAEAMAEGPTVADVADGSLDPDDPTAKSERASEAP
jgi:hypothetical protein